MGSPLSDGIKVFESEAWWIDALVALKAGGVVSVFDELVANGGGAPDVGINGGDIVGWWRGRSAEEIFEEPDAPDDGGGFDAVGGHGENRAHTEKASASLVGQGDFAEPVGGLRCEVQGELVVVGQVLVYESEVGVDEVGDGEVFFDEVFGEELGFAAWRVLTMARR